MTFKELDAFKKDVKGLSKKYRSLEEDLMVVRKILRLMPDERPPFSTTVEEHVDSNIIKVRKIACKSLKGHGGNSGLQLLYAYFEKEEKIVLIGLYHADDKPSVEKKMMLRKLQ